MFSGETYEGLLVLGRGDLKSVGTGCGVAFLIYPLCYYHVIPGHVGGVKFQLMFALFVGYDIGRPVEKVSLVRHAIVLLITGVLRLMELAFQLQTVVIQADTFRVHFKSTEVAAIGCVTDDPKKN